MQVSIPTSGLKHGYLCGQMGDLQKHNYTIEVDDSKGVFQKL